MNVPTNIIRNARNLGHKAHTAAFALALLGMPSRALCCWCAEHVKGEAHRLPKGGDCSACAYSGADTLVIVEA